MTTWREVAAGVEQRLAAAGIERAEVEARRLIEEASGFEGAEYHKVLDRAPLPLQVASLERMTARRLAGEPLQYALGRWAFRGLDLMVDHRVLIPRPETEAVVERAIAEVEQLTDEPVVVDLGTGSGAIALSIAADVPGATVWAADVSADALEVARANLAGLGRPARRVRLVEGWWFDGLDPDLAGAVDLIVSNPPYIADDEELPAVVGEHEPVTALRSGPSGLECIETIVRLAPRWLRTPGVLVVELAPHQAEAAAHLARAAGFAEVEIGKDLAGRDRMLVARWR